MSDNILSSHPLSLVLKYLPHRRKDWINTNMVCKSWYIETKEWIETQSMANLQLSSKIQLPIPQEYSLPLEYYLPPKVSMSKRDVCICNYNNNIYILGRDGTLLHEWNLDLQSKDYVVWNFICTEDMIYVSLSPDDKPNYNHRVEIWTKDGKRLRAFPLHGVEYAEKIYLCGESIIVYTHHNDQCLSLWSTRGERINGINANEILVLVTKNSFWSLLEQRMIIRDSKGKIIEEFEINFQYDQSYWIISPMRNIGISLQNQSYYMVDAERKQVLSLKEEHGALEMKKHLLFGKDVMVEKHYALLVHNSYFPLLFFHSNGKVYLHDGDRLSIYNFANLTLLNTCHYGIKKHFLRVDSFDRTYLLCNNGNVEIYDDFGDRLSILHTRMDRIRCLFVCDGRSESPGDSILDHCGSRICILDGKNTLFTYIQGNKKSE